MDVRRYIISEIIVREDRVRDLDKGVVAFLAEDITQKGLLQPIGVYEHEHTKKITLIYGEHRLMAVASSGDIEIDAVFHECNSLQAKLIEIDENIVRAPLKPLEFAAALTTRKVVYEAAYPLSKNGAKGLLYMSDAIQKRNNALLEDSQERNNALLDDAPSFVQAAADRLGLSKDKIKRALLLDSNINPNAADIVSGHPIEMNTAQLTALSRLERDLQEKVAQHIVDGTYASVSDATDALLGKIKPSAEDILLSRQIDTWARASSSTKTAFLQTIGKAALPIGWTLSYSAGDDNG